MSATKRKSVSVKERPLRMAFSVSVPAVIVNQIDQIAEREERSRNFVIGKAIEAFIKGR